MSSIIYFFRSAELLDRYSGRAHRVLIVYASTLTLSHIHNGFKATLIPTQTWNGVRCGISGIFGEYVINITYINYTNNWLRCYSNARQTMDICGHTIKHTPNRTSSTCSDSHKIEPFIFITAA